MTNIRFVRRAVLSPIHTLYRLGREARMSVRTGGATCFVLTTTIMAMLAGGRTTAQCALQWSAVGSPATSSALNGWVFALARLPNGDLVVGGSFTLAGTLNVNHIAR